MPNEDRERTFLATLIMKAHYDWYQIPKTRVENRFVPSYGEYVAEAIMKNGFALKKGENEKQDV